jgi:catechol 2,3-dioxygenase
MKEDAMFDRLGPVRYRTPNPEPLIGFYRDVLGFTLRSKSETEARLGAPDRDLVILTVDPAARAVKNTTGLYHTAFLFPRHRDLVHMLGRIARSRTPIEGFNHHGTHEAIYLPDPDGNGVELAWDLPQSEWPLENGKLNFWAHDKVFDPDAVLAEFDADNQPWEGIPTDSRVGHVHLHMSQFAPTRRFYTEGLGLDVMMEVERQGMLFLSAEGYHHHVGNNLWKGVGLPPAPADAVGLVEYTWKVPKTDLDATRGRVEAQGSKTEDRAEGFFVKDPSGIGIAVSPL